MKKLFAYASLFLAFSPIVLWIVTGISFGLGVNFLYLAFGSIVVGVSIAVRLFREKIHETDDSDVGSDEEDEDLMHERNHSVSYSYLPNNVWHNSR